MQAQGGGSLRRTPQSPWRWRAEELAAHPEFEEKQQVVRERGGDAVQQKQPAAAGQRAPRLQEAEVAPLVAVGAAEDAAAGKTAFWQI